MSERKRALVRPHVVTCGRAHPSRNTFELTTLVSAAQNAAYDRLSAMSPEKRRLVELCRGGALSVAEVAGHLGLPIGVTRVLLADLLDSGHITTYASAASSQLPSAQILQEVLDGLRARL